jgi:glycolate oxidase FAD binding subunit
MLSTSPYASPSSTEEAADLLRDAGERRVVIRGAGTKQDWGGTLREPDLVLDTRGLTGIVEHAAGDLIVVVRAGTPMAELRAHLAAKGQQLALDEQFGGATVGGTIAANVSGPRRMLYGTARDLVIGLTVVLADGTVAHSGGKVVKNVAGYDLGKLFTGSYGTLGLITQLTFRLHPVPPSSAFISRRVPDIGRALAEIRRTQVVPSAVEIDSATGEVAVLVEGTPAGVAARSAALTEILGDEPGTPGGERGTPGGRPDWWGRYPWEPGGTGIKVTAALSRIPDLLTTGIALRGSAGTGVLYAGSSPDTPPEEVAAVLDRLRVAARDAGGHAVVLTAPPPVRERVDLWGPVDGLALMWRVKQQFDPGGVLAAGRFVGGI